MKRFISIVFITFVCFLLQSTIFQYLALAGSVPNLLLIVTVSFGYMQGKKTGLFTGLFNGFLVDCLYGSAIGFYAFCYMIVGYLAGICFRFYERDDYVIPICLVAVNDFIYNFFIYFLEFALRQRFDFFEYFKMVMVPEIVYTAFVSIFLYKLLHSFNCFLRHFENKEA